MSFLYGNSTVDHHQLAECKLLNCAIESDKQNKTKRSIYKTNIKKIIKEIRARAKSKK